MSAVVEEAACCEAKHRDARDVAPASAATAYTASRIAVSRAVFSLG